jgi:2-polyprenyl-6-methoxyphenol hydroxylase-like FAD-dependent oxidoreductase
MVRTAAGLPAQGGGQATSTDPGTDLKVLGFYIGAQVAQQYHAGRPGVFLAGDSARIIIEPTSGNTGVQGAHNLAWKLWQRRSTARLVPRYSIPLSQ